MNQTLNPTQSRIVAATAALVVMLAGGSILQSETAGATTSPRDSANTAVAGAVFTNQSTSVRAEALSRPARLAPSTSKAVKGAVFTPKKPARVVTMIMPPRAKQVTRGIKPSAYTGKHYNPKFEMVRRCIVKRESEGQYDVRYPDRTVSTAAGAYQFIIGTSNHVAELINRPDLIGVPASQWDRETQDRGFWRLWDNGKGKHHWAGGRWPCWK